MEWIKCSERLPNVKKCLAIFVPEQNRIYNTRYDGWQFDTIYACWIKDGRFIIESHGPELPATHWMPLPEKPTN